MPDKNEVFLKVILLSDDDINFYFNINNGNVYFKK